MGSWPFSDTNVRAMYAGGRADARGRRFARLWAAVFGLGLVPKLGDSRGSRNDARVGSAAFPLGMARFGGPMVSRADAGRAPQLGPERSRDTRAGNAPAPTCHRLVELPVDERPPIIKRYLQVVRGARSHISEDRRASDLQFERIAPDYPVFRVDADLARNPVLYAPGRQKVMKKVFAVCPAADHFAQEHSTPRRT